MTTRSVRTDADVVGELVDVVPFPWEKRLELFARAVYGVDDAIGEFPRFETNGELRRDFIPETRRDFAVDPAVAEDHETLLLGGDEEEHTIAKLGPGHT